MYTQTYGTPPLVFTDHNRFSVSTAQPEYLSVRDIPKGQDALTQKYPLRHFALPLDSGQFQSFKHSLLKEFRTLSWDLYDVRLKRKRAIEAHMDLTAKQNELLLDFYRGEVSDDAITDLYQSLPPRELEKLQSLRPYRKKACSTLIARTENSEDWSVSPLAPTAVLQRVALSDYRSIARKYKPLPDTILNAQGFKSLLSCVIHMVREAQPHATSLEITAWMMSCYTWIDGPTTNSPEGVHQDGADYVVTAFVIERENINGGISRVFADDMQTPRAEILVQPAEGLFHADAGSSLWHDVSHIEVCDRTQDHGIRSVLGLDINIRSSKPPAAPSRTARG